MEETQSWLPTHDDDAQIMAPFLGYETLMRDYVIDPVVYNVHPPYYGWLGWRLPILGAPLVVMPLPVVGMQPVGGMSIIICSF